MLFPARAPFEFAAINKLREFLRTSRGNMFLLVITDRFSKLFQTVSLKRTTAKTVAEAIVRHWVLFYRSPFNLLSDNGPQFTTHYSQDVCRILDVKTLFTTTYHPQCNRQVERFDPTILSALPAYTFEHPRTWDVYTDTLTYPYNTQVDRVTGLSPFELVLPGPPPPVAGEPQPTLDKYPSPADHYLRWNKWLTSMVPVAK